MITPRPTAAAADPLAYRRALAQFATGVTVVTARAADGQPIGLTVNSFSSVSLAPPLVLWSLALKASRLADFRQCSHYAINVLAADQLEVAQVFATAHPDRFGAVQWHAGPLDQPLIDGAVAWFVAANGQQHQAGDHVILVGEVLHYANAGGVPLIFHDGRYVDGATETPLPSALRW